MKELRKQELISTKGGVFFLILAGTIAFFAGRHFGRWLGRRKFEY